MGNFKSALARPSVVDCRQARNVRGTFAQLAANPVSGKINLTSTQNDVAGEILDFAMRIITVTLLHPTLRVLKLKKETK